MVSENTKTAAGVHFDMNGHRVVGGSQRADGSLRKTVRVRPGFTPAEDIKRISVLELREKREKCVIEVTDGDDTPLRTDQGSFSGLSKLIRSNVAENKVNNGIKTAMNRHHHSVNKSDAEKRSDQANAERDLSIVLEELSVIDDRPSTKPHPKSKKYVPPGRRKYSLDDTDKRQ